MDHLQSILTPSQVADLHANERAGFTAASAGALAQVASSAPYGCPPGVNCFSAPPMLDYPVYPTGSPLSMAPLGWEGYSPYGYRSSPTAFYSMPG